MLKVVVFDGGWGGQNVANYLAEELGVIEIEFVIDNNPYPYELLSLEEICTLAEKSLKPYLGKVDLIVLGGYMSSLALDTLRDRHPSQRFVGMGIDYRLIYKTRRRPQTITIMGDKPLVRLPIWAELRNRLPEVSLIAPDCSGWESLIDMGEMSPEIIKSELSKHFYLTDEQFILQEARAPTIGQPREERVPFIKKFWRRTARTVSELIQTDTILLLNTHYWDLKPVLERFFGRHVRVLDFRRKLLHDVCLALNLRGLDGRLGE